MTCLQVPAPHPSEAPSNPCLVCTGSPWISDRENDPLFLEAKTYPQGLCATWKPMCEYSRDSFSNRGYDVGAALKKLQLEQDCPDIHMQDTP